MEINDYQISRHYFSDHSHLEIGDGLIYVRSKNKSEIINYAGKTILSIPLEYSCYGVNNGHFVICNKNHNYNDWDKQHFKIVDINNEEICTFKSSQIFLFPSCNFIICRDDEDFNNIKIIDYNGKELLSYNCGTLFRSAKVINNHIIALEFETEFEYDFFKEKIEGKYYIIDIIQKKVILQGETKEGYDLKVIDDVDKFDLPLLLPNENRWVNSYEEKNKKPVMIPVIKYHLSSPDFDEKGEAIYPSSIYFSDFLGNIVKETEYSQIESKTDGFYIVRKGGLCGILDSNFQEFLPCRFFNLIMKRGKIVIEHPTWSDSLDSELDIDLKRFWDKKKNGFSILLPYLYHSCDDKFIEDTNEILIFAEKYNEKGENLKGIINRKGDEILPAIYKTIKKLSGNLYIAQENDNAFLQLLNIKDDSVIIKNNYLEIEKDDSIFRDRNDEKYYKVRILKEGTNNQLQFGIINKEGDEILSPRYDFVFFPREGRVTYIKDGIPGWIDLSDNSSHEYPSFTIIRPFKSETAIVSKALVTIQSYRWDQYNEKNIYQNITERNIKDDICPHITEKNQKLGLINRNGIQVVPCEYEQIYRCFENPALFIVKAIDSWGAINKKGEIIIPIDFEGYNSNLSDYEKEEFNADFKLWKGEESYYYDKEGELICSINTEENYKQQRRYESIHSDFDYDDNYDYERDTYYALGGDDYDSFRENGGSIDDMMDGMGF